MTKDKYFGGASTGKFLWGKGLDLPADKRSKVAHDSSKPRFQTGGSPMIAGMASTMRGWNEGGSIRDDEKRNNREEMTRIKRRGAMEQRDLKDEEARIHRRAEDERRDYKKGGTVKKPKKDSMFDNPNLTKGGLHESLGIPMGKKIGMKKIDKATHSRNPLERKQAVLAENMMGKKRK